MTNGITYTCLEVFPVESSTKVCNVYEFENIKDSKLYKEKYRSVLDELPLTESEKNAIITEANYAFRLNMYMFDELKGNAAKSFFQIVFRAIFDRIPR